MGTDEAIATAEAGRPAEHLNALRRAARDHERITIEYFAGSTGAWTTRDVEPEEVFSAMGNWYVAAWDVGADDERLFRADRIRAVTGTGYRFEVRGLEGAGRALYTPTGDEVPCGCRRPGARWIAEYYVTDDPRELDDGSLEVTLPSARLGGSPDPAPGRTRRGDPVAARGYRGARGPRAAHVRAVSLTRGGPRRRGRSWGCPDLPRVG